MSIVNSQALLESKGFSLNFVSQKRILPGFFNYKFSRVTVMESKNCKKIRNVRKGKRFVKSHLS